MTESKNNEHFFDVGIDSMGFYTPKSYISLTDLAEVRNVDPNKYLKGLLTKEMRIPGVGEDIVSMAVKAGQYALTRGNINPSEIDAIFLGTETMTYAVKSVSNILAEILNTSLNCVTQDVYNACAGETLAVLNAVGLINNGIINKALIIGADICSYKLESPGEPTQGAAAAAVVITKNPRIAAFSKRFGKLTANINDFYRLPYEDHPVVFGQYSIDSYINFQQGALDDFFKDGNLLIPDYLAFHSPFAKLPLKSIQNLLLNRWDIMKKILLEKPVNSALEVQVQDEAVENVVRLINDVINPLNEKEHFDDVEQIKEQLLKSLTHKLLPTLNVPMNIGNMYSASIWAQLIYLLETVVKPNDVIYFGSYGSGATCISGMLKVMPQALEFRTKHPTVTNFIQNKERKTIKEYEHLRKKIDARKVIYAQIEPHPSVENHIITLNICDGGCLASKMNGLEFCPKGKHEMYTRNLPLYAVVKEVPLENIEREDVFSSTIVRVSEEVKKGNVVEYNLLRAGKNESMSCVQSGYINWIPTYKPINHPLT
ncbi:MAG: putative hydroxymethylglutaryl-CoA synthase [Promethearchaeota archaeon]|nr:MAG: putative hydroxymethylglutaryl-CoA synthase [Candidatus Lokiarchaeota archaeon]